MGQKKKATKKLASTNKHAQTQSKTNNKAEVEVQKAVCDGSFPPPPPPPPLQKKKKKRETFDVLLFCFVFSTQVATILVISGTSWKRKVRVMLSTPASPSALLCFLENKTVTGKTRGMGILF